MDPIPRHLLVYGLLRKGLSMNNLMEAATPLRTQHVPGFDLYDLGDYPGAVPGRGKLVAELFALPDGFDMQPLDEAEGVFDDPPLYAREAVECANLDGTSPTLAWLYIYQRDITGKAKIESGDWLQRD